MHQDPAERAAARLSRRSLLASGCVGLGLAASCSTDKFSAPSSPASKDESTAAGAADLLPDEQRAAAIKWELVEYLPLLKAVARSKANVGERKRFKRLITSHQDHLDFLDPIPTTGDPANSRADLISLTSVRLFEAALSKMLIETATEAEMGDWAGAFAQMYASLEQHRALLKWTKATEATPEVSLGDAQPNAPEEIEELQRLLRAEHRAVYLFGLLGARISSSQNPREYSAFTAAYRAHRNNRDTLREVLSRAGQTPAAAQASYPVNGPLNQIKQVKRAGQVLEDELAAGYQRLVVVGAGQVRSWAIDALKQSALRGLKLGAGPQSFPGSGS